MNRSIKVLQVIDSLGMGGAETWLMELLRLWRSAPEKRVQMDFLLTGGKAGLFDEEARRLGAKLFYVPFKKKNLPCFAIQFRRILKSGRYDVIHDHGDYASGLHFFFGAGYLPPIRITHVHNPAYQILNNYGVNALRRFTSRLGRRLVAHYSTQVLGTSRQLMLEYGFFLPPFQHLSKAVIHCGFHLKRFDGDIRQAPADICKEFGWSPETPIILFAGRLDTSLEFDHKWNHKNSAFAVEVFRHCLTSNPRAKLLMAGACEYIRVEFEAHVRRLGLTESVRLLGIRHDIARLMLGANVLLFPSRAEGLGMVAVEAQAAGLPVLASTAVPRECVVIPELIQFKDLQEPAAAWAEELGNQLAKRRPLPTIRNARWENTGFNILVSARQLEEVYAR
jgi:glycosyltransferase EpsF